MFENLNDFVEDIKKSSFANKFEDYSFAQSFYAALCNTTWEYKKKEFSVSWRTSGRLVSDIRNSLFNLNEDYMDFYCSGIYIEDTENPTPEGTVTPEISECFEELNMVLIEFSHSEAYNDNLC